MKLASFFVLFSYLFIKLLAKVTKEETNLKEITYRINNYEEKIVVESNALLNIELNNFPPENVSWHFNEFNSDEIIEYKGKENRNTCTEIDNNKCENVTIFKFLLKDLTNWLLPTLEFIMNEKETGKPKSSAFVEMKLKEKNPPKEFLYKIGRENTEVLIEPNSLLLIELGNDSISPQEQYTIFNLNEVYSTGYIEYKAINYRSNCNAISIEPRKTDCGQTSIFNFKINEFSKDSILPTIKFSFRNMTSFPYSEDIFNVTLKLYENTTIIDEPEVIPTEYTYQIKGDTELVVSKHSIIKIELDVDISNGYEWLISNAQIIERTGLIEIIGNNYNYCGDKKNCFPTVTFAFLIKEIDSNDVLPNIKLTLEDMRLWKSARTITITLKQEEEKEEKVESQINPEVELEKFTYKIEEATEVTVEPNSILVLELEHKSTSSQYQWNLQNMNEILQTGLVEFQKIDYKDNNEVFTFFIKDVIDGRLLPTIRFINVNMIMSNYSTDILEVTLKLENSDDSDENLKEYVYEVMNDSEIIVESNSLVTLELAINLAMGYEWSIINYDELKTSGLIDFYGTQYNDITEKMWFRIKEVKDESTLPKIKLSYTNKSVSSTNNIFKKSVEISIKLKKDKNSIEKICSFKDYSCCTKSDAKVYYHDKDGDWGVENGNWCIIMEKQDQSTSKTITTTTTTTTTSSTPTSECFSIKLGYPCCQSNNPEDIVYSDNDGDWGKENSHWCGISIPTCQPKNGYLVCEKTKKVVYKDSDEWGVEHDQWCIICN